MNDIIPDPTPPARQCVVSAGTHRAPASAVPDSGRVLAEAGLEVTFTWSKVAGRPTVAVALAGPGLDDLTDVETNSLLDAARGALVERFGGAR